MTEPIRIRLTDAVHNREPVDPGPGIHLWNLLTAFTVSDDKARQLADGKNPGALYMDAENMMFAPELGCYKCEEPFSRYLYYRKCTGSLEVQP